MSYMKCFGARAARSWGWQVAAVTAALVGCGTSAVAQTTVPPGFSQTTIASGLSSATSLKQMADGRALIARQTGDLLVWKDGSLLATPMHTFAVSAGGEQGLIGVTVDPAFEANGFVYVYINSPAPGSRGKLKRITVAPGSDVSTAGSEVELFDLGASSGIHLGGEVRFGIDGKIYVALGDHANSANSQSLSSIFGKILRLNVDGSIPTDNPFYSVTTGDNRAIWALGLRNPFTFAFERGTGRMFINDVGAASWEEINEGIAGANYGWPQTEGPFDQATWPQFTPPVHAYPRSVGGTIVGGAFYDPPVKNFPASMNGDYFFGDFGAAWVRRLPAGSSTPEPFATGMSGVVDFDIDNSGRLLVLRRSVLTRVEYTNPVGACCVGSACTTVLESVCISAGGVFQGIAVACAPAGEPGSCCAADIDGNGAVEVPDIFAFLSAWFAGNAAADFDGNGMVQVPDIFAFLSAWFAGCSG